MEERKTLFFTSDYFTYLLISLISHTSSENRNLIMREDMRMWCVFRVNCLIVSTICHIFCLLGKWTRAACAISCPWRPLRHYMKVWPHFLFQHNTSNVNFREVPFCTFFNCEVSGFNVCVRNSTRKWEMHFLLHFYMVSKLREFVLTVHHVSWCKCTFTQTFMWLFFWLVSVIP